jgi:uncharacterized membrane protein (DUF2068 family)
MFGRRKPHHNSTHRWELLSCSWRGHETYEPTGSDNDKRFARQLSVNTKQGKAWRCLRCGTYVVGPPRHKGSVEDAPIVRRGKTLRQAIILRLLGTERIIRGLFLLLLGYGILRYKTHEGALQDVFNHSLPALKQIADNIGYDLDTSQTLHYIRAILNANQHTLTLAAIGAFVYAALQLTEGVGLWLMKRWGEYFAAVATALFIPLEIYEVHHHASILKIAALIINIAAVIYLVYSKRLFGLRGGGAAYEAELHEDKLLEFKRSSAE